MLHRIRAVELLLASALLVTAAQSCKLDHFGKRLAGAGGGGSGQAGGSQGGSGGSTSCVPQTTMACYSGPAQTADVGICQSGTQICRGDGSGFLPCEGEVLPEAEVCGNDIDEDCNGSATDSLSECLVNDGLLARYFIDEADGGMLPASLLDSAPEPLDLPIDYGAALSFALVEGHRCLNWTSAGDVAAAANHVDGTKLADLDGSQTFTIELVADVNEVVSLTGSSLFSLGAPAGAFSLSANTLNALKLSWHGQQLAL